ncbi:MAG: hypothetical protein ACOYJA_02895 [Christensenellales bacterium]|jgi:V/A-type H+-transporting ATPase subunit G/H
MENSLLNDIRRAEEQAQALREQTLKDSREALRQAEADATAQVVNLTRQARQAAREAVRFAQHEAEEKLAAERSQNDARLAMLQEKMQLNLPQAEQFIVEGIMQNGHR